MSDSVNLGFDEAEGYISADLPFQLKKINLSHVEAEFNPYMGHKDEDDESVSFGCEKADEEAIVAIADEYGALEKIPENPPDQFEKEVEKEIETNKFPSMIRAGIECFKYIYSSVLVIFCVICVMVAIFTNQTSAAKYKIPSAVVFFLFWFLLLWLGIIEGGQGCLVGLQSVDKSLYAETHKITHKSTSLTHKGDNMERFIVGRQFLVVLIIFAANMVATVSADARILGLSGIASGVFFGSGIALMLTTIVIAQLTAQVNGANCMLDFINNNFILFSSWVSLGIEYSGLLHSVYLVQMIFSSITGTPVESNEPPRNAVHNIFFWGRVLMSLAILGFSLAVTLQALFDGNSGMWDGVPAAASVIIFFLLLAFVGMMDGMQVAAFAVVNIPEGELAIHTIAHNNCQLIFSGENLQAFLIGRQICVAACMFIVTRIATITIPDGEPNIFGVSDGFQTFIDTGLLGAVVLTIIGSLAWRIVASSFPLAFMSNPLIYVIIRLCLLLEMSGLCSASWVLARYHKILAGYQPDEVYLEGSEKHTAAPVSRRDKDIDVTVTVVKYLYSSALLIFSMVLVFAGMFSYQTKMAKDVHPAFAFIFFWFLISWLALMEGGQACLVGLQTIAKSFYAKSHPITLKNTTLAHKGDNMERMIIGRQFLVVLVIFLINMCGSSIPEAEVLGLPSQVTAIFLGNGVAIMLTTIIVGQLVPQVNAAVCMLDFINNHFMLFTSWVSFSIEFSGLLHSVYLVKIIFSNVTGRPIESKEAPRSGLQNATFWGRVLMSLAILGFSLAVILKALFDGNSGMWDGVPAAASVIIFFLLLAFVGMMEGMQIAAFALLNSPDEEFANSTVAFANCQLMFSGKNLQAFLIGRQICVAACMFTVARIATISIPDGEPNIFGVSDGFQTFIDTGLLGAIVITIIGSLAWRIVASSFPLAFMSNPLIYVIIRLCLLLEQTCICSASWLLALIHKLLAGYQLDELYIGTSDERVAAEKSATRETTSRFTGTRDQTASESTAISP